MKKFILGVVLTVAIIITAACSKPADIHSDLLSEETKFEVKEQNIEEEAITENPGLYEISDIIAYGTSEIDNKDAVTSRSGIPMELSEVTVALYGSEKLSIPFTVNELMEATDEPLASYFYSDGIGTYAVIYPAGTSPTENAQVLLYFNTEEKENLDTIKMDGLILTGLNSMPAGSVLINGRDFTQDSYQSLISISDGLCSGFSSKTYEESAGAFYRILRFGTSEAAFNMDAHVFLDKNDKDVYSVNAITIR